MAVAASVTPKLVHQISADEAQATATDFLLDHIGNQLVAGLPQLMVSAFRSAWVVPVQLVYLHTESLGDVGVIAVDEETGQVMGWTPIEQMKIASQRLRAAQEPNASKQFEAFMTVAEDPTNV